MPLNEDLLDLWRRSQVGYPTDTGMNPLLPQLPQTTPQGNIMGMPTNKFVDIMGTAAAAIAPKSWGGRLGAGMVGLQQQNRENDMRDLGMRVGLGRYGMEQQEYQNKLAQQEAMARSRVGILGRLNQPGGYEDTTQQMSIPTPSPMEGLHPMERAYLEAELLSSNPNLSPLLKTTAPPKISGYKIPGEGGSPMYLNEYGQPTGIEAYVSPRDVEPYRVGTVREFTVGDRTAYKTYKGNGQWEDMKGVGGGRYKATTGGGGGVSNKDAEKYRKNVEAYNRETTSLDQQYYATINKPEYIGNSRSAIIYRNQATENYKKQLDGIIKKYRGKIDFVSNTPSGTTNLEKKIGNEWEEGGRKFRMNPQTGKKEMWIE